MSLFENFRLSLFFIGFIFSGVALGGELQGPQLGVPVEAGALSGWDISIGPEGRGLPNGEGDSRLGFTVLRKGACGVMDKEELAVWAWPTLLSGVSDLLLLMSL